MALQADIVGNSTLTSIPPLLERAKLGFVVALRTAFSSSVTNPDLLYDNDKNKSKLRIYTAQPLTLEFYPSMVVSTGGGDISFQYMQDDLITDDVSAKLVTFSGKVTFTVSVTIFTNSTLERERIIDHLIFFLRHIFRPNLHAFGIEYTKDMSMGPEEQLEVENRAVYRQVLDIPCYMEYTAQVDQSLLATLRDINLVSENISIQV